MPRLSISSASGPVVTLNGRQVVSFGGCNYLGLSWNRDVRAALLRALDIYGISTSASRETTGNTQAHDHLEASVRSFLGAEAAIVLPDGFTANLAAAQTLAQTHRAALVDARCHRSIREAIAGAGLDLHVFNHRSAAEAAAMLQRLARSTDGPISLWTDGVFAADGSVAPVPALLAACREHGAVLVIDDCHGFCSLGATGRGTLEHFNVNPAEDIIITTTLAKGLGCHGGAIAATTAFVDSVRAVASAYICTTPVSPAIAAAAAEALAVLRREPDRLARLRRNAAHLADSLNAAGLAISPGPAPVFAFTLPSFAAMRTLHDHLLAAGFLAPLIDYPDGPAPAYFRISVTSEHTPAQISAFAAAIPHALAPADHRTVTA